MPVNYLSEKIKLMFPTYMLMLFGKLIKCAELLQKLLTILSKSSPPFTYSRTMYIFDLLARTWLFISQETPLAALEFNSCKYYEHQSRFPNLLSCLIYILFEYSSYSYKVQYFQHIYVYTWKINGLWSMFFFLNVAQLRTCTHPFRHSRV